MSSHTYYRCAVWLPLLVPAATAIVIRVTGLPPTSVAATVVQMIVASGIYGGVPYALLAAYATWWIGGRSERELKRRGMAAPLWLVLLWLPFSALVGALSGQIETFAGFFLLGAAVILSLGYAYVGLVFILRTLIVAPRSQFGS
jgi:hypothetical protein